MNTKPFYLYLAIALFAALTFIPFLGGVHLFDWDEINFAEAAREMVVTGNYSKVTIDYKAFWEKPPLFFWMQALSMNLFGINEFAARFPNALCGMITLLLFIHIGRKLRSREFGLYWAALYLCSLLPQLYFKSGIIDPWFNLFIFLGTWFCYRYYENEGAKIKWALLSGISIGLSVLTKGPVGFLIFFLCFAVYQALYRLRRFPPVSHLLVFMAGLIVFGGAWMISETVQGRFYIVQDFINYQVRLLQTQDAGHGGPFYYHVIVLLIGCFPMSVFAARKLFQKPGSTTEQQRAAQWMLILFWVVLILFSIVSTKIVHYSSLCYFPMGFFAASAVLKLKQEKKLRVWLKASLITLWILWIILLLGIARIGNTWGHLATLQINDPVVQDLFNYPSPFSTMAYLPGVILLITLIAFFLVKTNQKKVYITITGSFLTFLLAFALLIPNVEYFSQRGAIEFYKKHRGDVVYPIGFKSYAHLFYTEKPAFGDPRLHSVDALLADDLEREIYFVAKVSDASEVNKKYPFLQKIGSDRGFVFYRKP